MELTPSRLNRIQHLVLRCDLKKILAPLFFGLVFLGVLSCGATTGGNLNSSGGDEAGEGSSKSDNGITSSMIQMNTPGHSFWIDPYEVSQLAPGDFFSARNQLPHANVTREQAQKICASSGKRLCNSFEWKNACLGIHRHRFSYSSTYEKGYCNVDSSTLKPGGSMNRCSTDTGLFDMVGNGMEWVADEKGGRVIAMGGSFETGEDSDCFTSFYFPRDFKSSQITFRCCY